MSINTQKPHPITDKYQLAIMDYECWRQIVSDLQKKRSRLITNCAKKLKAEKHHNDGGEYSDPKPCLYDVYDETIQVCKDNGEYFTMDEVIEDMVADGACCQNCLDAFKLKNNTYREARHKFGIAKRSLSAMGKALIKKDASDDMKELKQ